MNKKIFAIVGLMAVTAFALVAFTAKAASYYSPGNKAYITSVGAGNSLAAGQTNATTSVAYLSTAATASSTIVGYFGRGDQLDFVVQATGSSSAAVLGYSVDWSDDQIDWFTGDEATSTSGVPYNVHQSVETQNTWSVATTSATGNTVRRHFIISEKPVAAFYRIRFSTAGANMSVWAYAVTKETVPN